MTVGVCFHLNFCVAMMPHVAYALLGWASRGYSGVDGSETSPYHSDEQSLMLCCPGKAIAS